MLNIREIRQRQGYTQKEVCLTLNIPQNTFSQYENNKREPDTETLTRIADFFLRLGYNNITTFVVL